jgi:hypothetical protein
MFFLIDNPFFQSWDKIRPLVTKFFWFAVIIILGFVCAWVVKKFLSFLLKLVRFDSLCFRIGFSSALSKAGITRLPSDIAGILVYWILAFLFLLAGMSSLNMAAVDQMVNSLFSYLPHFLIAILVFIIGYVLAQFLSRATLIALVNAQIKAAKPISILVQLLILILFIAMGIEQLGVAKGVVIATFSIFFGGVVLALAIAFGLGGKDIAKDFLNKRLKSSKEPKTKPDELSHL